MQVISTTKCKHDVRIIKTEHFQWRQCKKCGYDFEIEYR